MALPVGGADWHAQGGLALPAEGQAEEDSAITQCSLVEPLAAVAGGRGVRAGRAASGDGLPPAAGLHPAGRHPGERSSAASLGMPVHGR